MKAIVTGASSGIGREFSKKLSDLGYDIVICARREERLQELKNEINTNVTVFPCDLSKEEEIFRLFENHKDADILINNAGFGVFGEFLETDLERELQMIAVNIKSVHILTKLFLSEMEKRNNGYILNVASSAAFFPGPKFSSYYASKSYVYRLTLAIAEEIKKAHKNVHISVLCPGPVDTEFNEVAGVHFGVKPITAKYCAEYALNKMLKNKVVITPGFIIKLSRFASKITPDRLSAKITYKIQEKKVK